MIETSEVLREYERLASGSLESARCLPFAVYHDPEVHALEVERVFRDEWVFVGTEQELPEPGDSQVFELAGESVVLLRGRDGKVRALSNNCRHRGTPLVDDGFTSGTALVCPYHGWSYDDQGRLTGVPFAGTTDVDPAEHRLPGLRLESWNGLLFLNVSGKASPLAERLAGIDEYLSVFEVGRFVHGTRGPREDWHANWKLVLENAMESYHLFKVHRHTVEGVSPTKDAFYVAGSTDWTLTAGRMTGEDGFIARIIQGEVSEVYHHYLLLSLPPSLVAVVTYDSLDWVRILPTGLETCQFASGSIAAKAGAVDAATEKFTADFFAEDRVICERVQRGMHSRVGSGGKLVDLERVVVDFHRFLAGRLFQTPPAARFVDEGAALFTSPSLPPRV